MKELTISDIIEIGGVFNDGDWVESKDQNPNGLVRLIQLADIGDGYFINKSQRFLTKSTAQRLKCTFLRKGDILIARMPDPIGRACIFPGLEQEAVTVVDVCIIRPNNKGVFVPFLKFLINSPTFRQQIARHVTGTTRKRISRKNLNKVTFHLPSLTDQKRIAKVLSDCEQLIAWRKESIQLLDDYLESVFLEMFGDPRTNERLFSKEPISNLCDVGTGATPSRKKEAVYYNGEYKWIKTTSVNGSLILDSKERITQRALDETNCKLYPPGTILVAMYGQGKTRGHVGLLGIEAATNQACAAIVPGDKIRPHFLFYQLKYSYESLRSLGRGGNQENLNLSLVKGFNVLVPDDALQEKFIKIVNDVNGLKELLKSSLSEIMNLYSSLSQKAFKGELDLSKVVVEEEVEPAQSPEETTKVSAEKEGQPSFKKAATKPKGKRDIRNLTLLDHLGVPEELYVDKIADDYGPELDFIGDDLFYQFYLKDHFADQSFTFSDLQQKFDSHYIPKGQDFEPHKWKAILYQFMEGKQPLVEQIFEEKTGTIKLKLTDEAFKA
ncbi:MAG: restriction endonuclease subunit S [Bacteroidota bacterium]